MPSILTKPNLVAQPRKIKKSSCCKWKSCFSLSNSTYVLDDDDSYCISLSQMDASVHEGLPEATLSKTEVTQIDLSKYKPPTVRCRPHNHPYPVRKRRISIIGDMDCDLRIWCVTREVSGRILDEYIDLETFAEYIETYEFPIEKYRFCPLLITFDTDEDERDKTPNLEELPEQTLREMGMFPLLRQFTPTASELAFNRRRAWTSMFKPRIIHRRWSADRLGESLGDKKPRNADIDIKAAEKANNKHYRNEAIKARRQAQLKYWHEYVKPLRSSMQRDVEVARPESEAVEIDLRQYRISNGRYLWSDPPIFIPNPVPKRRISVTGDRTYDSRIITEYQPTNDELNGLDDSESSLEEGNDEYPLFISERAYYFMH